MCASLPGSGEAEAEAEAEVEAVTMAGKGITGEGLSANLAGMTKNQLYDIMSQMKTLIEQNRQQARQILIQNPPLTKALFQAQIMLGMVHSPQAIPNIQAATQQPQQSAPVSQQPNIHALPVQVSSEDQTSVPEAQPPLRKQHQPQQAMSTSSASGPPVNLQSQPMPSHSLQTPQQQPKMHMNPQPTAMSVPQSSQLQSVPPPLSLHQPQMPSATNLLQQPLQTTGFSHLPLQPPFSQQARPPSMPPFHHQYGQQMGPGGNFQHTGAPQHPSQPIFHSANKPQPNVGPSFQQGQLSVPTQPPPQSMYQMGGSHMGVDFSNQTGSSMQVDRGSSWMPGPPDSSTMTQLSTPSSLVPGQMGPGNQSSRSAQLTPDMEKALLQQVMSLTPDQINHLPPEQRNQVLQLQQMLRR